MSASVDELRADALALLADAPEGEPLDDVAAALVALGTRAAVSTLDVEGIHELTRRALDAGATGDQVHETLVLVSGLGVHTLMTGSTVVADVLRERGEPTPARDAALWERHVGDDPYWEGMEREAPGFLDALARLSPEAFAAFFAYCAVPWRTGALPAVTKELVSLAVDAMPAHRYGPGLRLHARNAAALGAGRRAIEQALDIAAAAPDHRGVR